MSFIEKIITSVVLEEARISEKEQLSEAAFRIRIQGDSIPKINFAPGAFLRVGIGIGMDNLPMKDKIRSYSIWDIDTQEAYMDLAVSTQGAGIGRKWAQECQVGDKVYFKLKKGNFLADDTADSYLMIGDLSALSHLYMINKHLGANKQVESMIYSGKKSDLFPDKNGITPFDFYQLEQNPTPILMEKIKTIVASMTGKKMAYIAGDSRVCLAINQFLRNELNWETNQVKTKPFWNPQKKGLE